MTIKAISLWQPWATAWAIGLKKAETRHWIPFVNGQQYLGPLAVHAAKTERDPETRESLPEWFHARLAACDVSRDAFAAHGITRWEDLPRGQVIAVCRLDAVRMTENDKPGPLEQTWGNYAPKRFAWVPCQMTLLPKPVPCVGRQGLFNWEVPADLLALPQIRNALSAPPF